MKPVRFTAIALREVDQVAAFYEGRKEGLGVEFYERIDEAVANIRQNPEGYRKVVKDLRRCNLSQFKDWALWFRVNPDSSLVVSVPFWAPLAFACEGTRCRDYSVPRSFLNTRYS